MNAPTPEIPTDAASGHLLAGFAKPDAAQWRAAAVALLKGAPFEKKLITRTPEGIDLQPIYSQDDLAALAVQNELPGCGTRRRGSRASGQFKHGWEISQEFVAPTPEEFNSAALHDLERGQTELNVLLDLATLGGRDPDLANPGEVGACGLSLATLGDVERAFAGISLPMVSIYLRAGPSALPAAALLLAFARKRGIPPRELRGCIESDPLAMLAWSGSLPVSLSRVYDELTALTWFAIHQVPALQTIAVQGTPYADAGASAVQELAFTLATGVEYLREVKRRGVAIDDAARHVRLSLSAGSNFFMEVAKFRAARHVWTLAVRALGASAAAGSMHLHVRTSTFNKTAVDIHGNILRGTTEALAAVVGGCDSLHVAPFDEALRPPTTFSRRIARNVHTIIGEECDLNRVIDPAGGSYYVEWLTDAVGRRAWSLFQEIEKMGGMARALAAGFPQKLTGETATTRAEAVAKRRTTIVGANQYPNARENRGDSSLPDYAALQRKRAQQVTTWRNQAASETDTVVLERLAGLLQAKPAEALELATDAIYFGATLGEVCRALRSRDESSPRITPLRIHRAAQPFERLRDAATTFAADTGRTPVVFQANIGPSRLYRQRADWTTGFFAVGGFEVVAERDFPDATEAVAAVLGSGVSLVVLTSTDESYATVVEPFARALKAANANAFLLVAGAAKDPATEAAWRAAGVDEFVNLASNALDLLTRLLIRIGVLT